MLSFVKKLDFEPIMFNYYTDMTQKLIARTTEFRPFGFITDSDDRFGFTIQNEYDYVEETFIMFEDVIIPIGGYEWWFYELDFDSNRSRPVALEVRTRWGDFYNGVRTSYDVECIFKSNMHYALATDVRYNNITIGNRMINTKEYGGRLSLDFSTRLSSSTFVQWNNETKEINVNFRIHYIPKIGSDMYLVYNHLLDDNDSFSSLNNTAMLKMDYTYRF